MTVQWSSGPHVSDDAYVQGLAQQGVVDSGATDFFSFQPRYSLTLDHNGAGLTMGYVYYSHNAARYDNTPQPVYSNDYVIGITRQFFWWLTGGLYVDSLTQTNWEKSFTLPSITGSTAVNLSLTFAPLPIQTPMPR